MKNIHAYKGAWWAKYGLDIHDLWEDKNLPKEQVKTYNLLLWQNAIHACDEQIRVKIIQRKAGLTSEEHDNEIARIDRAKQLCEELRDENKMCSLSSPEFEISFKEMEDAIRLAYNRLGPPISLIALHDNNSYRVML